MITQCPTNPVWLPTSLAPDKLGLTPDKPGTVSDKLGLVPDQPGLAPDKPGTVPDKSGAVPDKLDLAPEQPGLASDKRGAMSDKLGLAPDKLGALAHMHGATPNNTGTLSHTHNLCYPLLPTTEIAPGGRATSCPPAWTRITRPSAHADDQRKAQHVLFQPSTEVEFSTSDPCERDQRDRAPCGGKY